jgi:4-hydroxybutyrate dehydrogenase
MALIPYMARIQFEFGAVALLREELDLLGVKRPLVVTDKGIVGAGLVERALASIRDRSRLAVFSETPANPTEQSVLAALSLLRRAQCDGIVAVGGGSSIDAAKAVALLATHAGPLDQYQAVRGGGPKILSTVLPLIAVPTTAGTGSEVGRGMGITLEDDTKAVFISQNLIPKVAICDPDLTESLPPALAAGTGADALSHCVEAYLSPAINPPADAIALDGAQRLWAFLPRATSRGDREARWQVMMGALEGGMSMWKGLGPAHAIGVALEREAGDLHHGTTVGVLMPHALRFLGENAAPKSARLRNALGLPDNADLAAAFESFNATIGLPATLRALGVAKGVAAAVGEMAAASFFNQSSARRGSAAEYAELVEAAL